MLPKENRWYTTILKAEDCNPATCDLAGLGSSPYPLSRALDHLVRAGLPGNCTSVVHRPQSSHQLVGALHFLMSVLLQEEEFVLHAETDRAG